MLIPAILFGISIPACKRQTAPQGIEASPSPKPQAIEGEWLSEVSAPRGLRFVHESSGTDRYGLPAIIGSGAALFDYDNDGRLDILLIQNGGPQSTARNKLFHQEPDGTFRDVSAGSGLDIAAYGMGVAIGDVNNDGLPDVLLTAYGTPRLLHNRGNGHFEDVTHEAGLDAPGWSVSAAFCDFDRDGWLDLVIVQYVAYSPSVKWLDVAGSPDYPSPALFSGSSTRVYRNLGRAAGSESVRFEDVSFSSGVGRVPGPGLGVVCADFDGDAWPDIFVTNDGAPNHLWINQRDFSFREEGLSKGIALNAAGIPQANMGIAIADLAETGWIDAFVTHLTEEMNVLWVQEAPGIFEDRTVAFGLASPGWRGTGFGTVFADFDNAGAPDLALVNGRVRRSRTAVPGKAVGASLWAPYEERNQLFSNDGKGRFRDVSNANPAFCSIPNVGRGLACGDIDNDGGIDLLVTDAAGPAKLFHNIAPHRGHWLLVRAIDPALGGRDAYGAHVIVHAAGMTRHGWVNPAYSFACSNDPRVHFGLGGADHFESIDVTWPDGLIEQFDGGAADRVLMLSRGRGRKPSAGNPVSAPSSATRPR